VAVVADRAADNLLGAAFRIGVRRVDEVDAGFMRFRNDPLRGASSVGPPNIMVPRQIGETFRPLRPSWRYCMGCFLEALVGAA
jgi:hypothetical protein